MRVVIHWAEGKVLKGILNTMKAIAWARAFKNLEHSSITILISLPSVLFRKVSIKSNRIKGTMKKIIVLCYFS